MKKLLLLFILLSLFQQTTLAQVRVDPKQVWPRPIPARIHNGRNLDLLVMTLGDVDTSLADGTFDPANDEHEVGNA